MSTAANREVDEFLAGAKTWRAEYEKLRAILHGFPLEEGLKWGVPCYMLNGKNVVLMHGFKEYCALLFVKGALLKNHPDILIQQTGAVQASRQIRFTSVAEISALAAKIRSCIAEAIAVEQAGLKIAFKKAEEFEVAAEFQTALDKSKALKAAFQALTPGRRRAYLLFFAAPKQAKTREARIEKCTPLILAGKGLND